MLTDAAVSPADEYESPAQESLPSLLQFRWRRQWIWVAVELIWHFKTPPLQVSSVAPLSLLPAPDPRSLCAAAGHLDLSATCDAA